MAEIPIYDAEMFVRIDETGCDRRNSKRRYSVRGIPPRDHRLLVRGVRYSGITVMPLVGSYAWWMYSWSEVKVYSLDY